jgi:choline dehydrogenase
VFLFARKYARNQGAWDTIHSFCGTGLVSEQVLPGSSGLSIHNLLTHNCDRPPLRHSQRHPANARRADAAIEYDYVIVGSGPGGAPLAARLAIAGHKVLLLEAGDDQGNATRQQVPALQLHSTEYEPMRWDYFVQHYPDMARQERDSKMTYRTPTGNLHVGPNPPANSEPLGVLYPRAGTLGGCSAHNAMM